MRLRLMRILRSPDSLTSLFLPSLTSLCASVTANPLRCGYVLLHPFASLPLSASDTF